MGCPGCSQGTRLLLSPRKGFFHLHTCWDFPIQISLLCFPKERGWKPWECGNGNFRAFPLLPAGLEEIPRPVQDSGNILKQGYLEKRSRGKNRNYRTRSGSFTSEFGKIPNFHPKNERENPGNPRISAGRSFQVFPRPCCIHSLFQSIQIKAWN